MVRKIIDIEVNYEKAGLKTPDRKPHMELLVPFSCGHYPDEDFKKRPTVLIVPGGAYKYLALNEADPVAAAFINRGFNCAVLYYSIIPSVFPTSLVELATAVKCLKTEGAQYGIDPEKIFVCGFSAGGHLTASLGTMWKSKKLEALTGADCKDYKAAGMILGYPVIKNHGKHNVNSFKNLLGENYGKKEYMELTSLEKQVTPDTLPAFIFHTFEDEAVDVSGTVMFAEALKENGVPFELHIFEHGGHGISIATRLVGAKTRASAWVDNAAEWMFEKSADSPLP